MPKAAIIGNTTWGNTLASLLSSKGIVVELWMRCQTESEGLNQNACGYHTTSHIEEAIEGASLVIWAVPSQKFRQNITQSKNYLTDSMILMSAAKGLEVNSGKRMSQIIAEEIPFPSRQICVLSGPNLAKEIAQGLPAVSVVASQDIEVAERARELVSAENFFVFSNNDVIGVELGGALKNVIALGAGMIDGLNLGDNAKAAFITLGWAEATSLGITLGAKASTFYSLAGLGDLTATCASTLSRNHYVGYELGKGRSLKEILASMTQVAEGVYTTTAVYHLAEKLDLKLPFTSLIYQVLTGNPKPSDVIARFSQVMSLTAR